MSFAMTEEQRMAVDYLRKFLDEKIEPEFMIESFMPPPPTLVNTAWSPCWGS